MLSRDLSGKRFEASPFFVKSEWKSGLLQVNREEGRKLKTEKDFHLD
jgi:hypothetical protein